MNTARKLWILAAFGAAAAWAQPVVAPTSERVGSPRGENAGEYNIVDSFETGYRFHTVDGNVGKYRSDVNYGNGVRLLGSYLTVNSREGNGRFFDEIVLTTQGLGGDPYESANFRIQKNRIYRYDLLWRLNDYYNPALPVALGEHLMDTQRTLQDHDFTLFPQGNVRFFLGYSRNVQTGPALSTIQFPNALGDEFPLFTNVRRVRNEYRIGNEIRAFGFRLNWLRGWEDFKDDTAYDLTAPNAGNNPTDATTLTAFQRREPYHGTSPYWRVALFREGRSRYGVNGRFTYTEGRRDFILDETALGSTRFGADANRQVLTYGNARRPVATGNLTLSLFPTERLTITNHTSIYHVRTEGDSTYREFDNATFSSEFVNFQYLGIRTIANQTEVNYSPSRLVGLFGGYNYSERRIHSIAQVGFTGGQSTADGVQDNHLHAGTFGVRFRPTKPLSFLVDAEVGRADQPIYPVGDRNYHALKAQAQYRTRTLSITAYARANYNNNSTSMTAFSSRSRDYAANASWTPSARVSFDAGYSKLHLDTIGGIAYFLNFQLITGDRSYYLSNIHAGNATAHFALTKLADLYIGYSRVQDTGDGRSSPDASNIGSTLPLFRAVQTFPLAFDSPLARLSVRLHTKIRWNVGYQFYHYREEFSTSENYRAHTGYTSLLWSF